MPVIYHIATPADWEQALSRGEYTTSKIGKKLEDEGFIHASTAGQVTGVANKFYRGQADLLLLVIDTARLTSELRYDPVPGAPAPFPHIYGPLNPSAVIDVQPLAPGPDGTFRFTLPGS